MANRTVENRQLQDAARAQISYWKKDRSIDDLYATDLAFSLIYDNIAPNKLDNALATMGLTSLPNVFLLVQIDDYVNKYGSMAVTSEFSIKAKMRNHLQNFIDNGSFDGFAANLVGLDTLICMLCLTKEELRQGPESILDTFSATLQQDVLQGTGIAVTICISGILKKVSDFPNAYTAAKAALRESFYTGANAAVISLRHIQPKSERKETKSFLEKYPEVCTAISHGKKTQFQCVLDEISNEIYTENISPKRAKAVFVGLLQMMEMYGVHCGLDNGSGLTDVSARFAERIMYCSFLADVKECLTEYFTFLSNELKKIPDRDQKLIFQEPIKEYIRNNYEEKITLAQMAKIAGYSPYYTTRLFKQYFGCTLSEYLTEFRIEQSKQMLRSTAYSVTQIASACGFESNSYYGACFRARTGKSPSQYRKDEQK